MMPPSFTDKHAISNIAFAGGPNNGDSIPESYSDDSQFTPVSQGSQELRGRAPVLSFNGQTRSAEKVLDKSRRFKKIAGVTNVCTDDDESIAPEFADTLKKSAILLKFTCQNVRTGKKNPYLGQAGLVRNPRDDTFMFATCKHNFGTDVNKEGDLEFCLAPHECVLRDRSSADINIPNTGWRKNPADTMSLRDGAEWSNGFDLALIPIISERFPRENWPNDLSRELFLDRLLSKILPFDVVGGPGSRDEFSYNEGLKIGIVVYNPGCADKEGFSEVEGLEEEIDIEENYADVTKGIEQCKIEQFLGLKDDDVMICTGYITFVGARYIEYNVNTYPGCSGAIVVVMDQKHADHGKAIAVHAGFATSLHSNIGFKLASAFDA